MGAIETEIKFRVADPARLESQLAQLGFTLLTPRSFESNTLYDTPDRALRAKRELVRIRQYNGSWLLTHKRVPDSGIGEDRHKHRVETETELSDGPALAEVFASIGLVPVFRYEKYRTEWADAPTDSRAKDEAGNMTDDGKNDGKADGKESHGHCVIDETPLGIFAELEGPPNWIDRIATALEVALEDRLTISYGRLFEQWKELTNSPAQDLTFAAVNSVPAAV